jgi:DNA-binding CsgD family transcriptional regulator
MALTGTEETDLILPLYEGIEEPRPFSSFLDRLVRRTAALSITLLIRGGEGPQAAVRRLQSGSGSTDASYDDMPLFDRFEYDALRPGRVYAMDEFVAHDPVRRADRTRRKSRTGIADERVVRLAGLDNAAAWLVMARERPCSAADSALLSTLAPYVAVAVRGFLLLEAQRIRSQVTKQSLEHSGAAWAVFDREARILAIEPALAELLYGATGVEPAIGERLRQSSAAAERALADAVARALDRPEAPQVAVLCDGPRIEALLTATKDMPVPTVLATCRLPRGRSEHSIERLAALFDLPRREAELAVALSAGLSIAEAAGDMGLTIETARNYSKRLYGKLGVRGQAGLVKLVCESAAVMA